MSESITHFVHQWFADLDELKPADTFLDRITQDFVFNIYGAILNGHQGFLSIYSGMQRETEYTSKHTATNIQVKELDSGLFWVTFDIALENHYPSGRVSRSESREEWSVQRQPDNSLRIKNYAIISN